MKRKVLRRGAAPSYAEEFLFISSFNVASYFQLKKICFFLLNLRILIINLKGLNGLMSKNSSFYQKTKENMP
jgi:hypothetical protein